MRTGLLVVLCVAGLGLIPAASAAGPETILSLKTRSQDQALDAGAIIIHVKTSRPTKLSFRAALRPGSVDRRYRLGSKTTTVDGAANIRFGLNSEQTEALAAAASTCTTSRVRYSSRHAQSGIKTTARAKLDVRPDC